MSTETHGVQPVELNEEGYGRYCISMFSGIANNPPNCTSWIEQRFCKP